MKKIIDSKLGDLLYCYNIKENFCFTLKIIERTLVGNDIYFACRLEDTNIPSVHNWPEPHIGNKITIRITADSSATWISKWLPYSYEYYDENTEILVFMSQLIMK